MLLCKKIKLNVTPEDAATLEFMQGKCRGLYNWWVMRLRDGEKWPSWRIAKKTLQTSKLHDPELKQVYKRVSQKQRNKQRDSLHKASHLIAHTLVESTVVMGDLSQRQMVMKEHAERNKHRNRAVFNEWGLYTFTEMLIYKCQLYGKELVFLDERNTSKACSGCGNLQAMPLWKRTYCCTNCGLVMDRDENSAVNILTRFLARRGPYTSSETCDVLDADQNGVEVVEASRPIQVQQ